MSSPEQGLWTRRHFLELAAGVGAGALLAACGTNTGNSKAVPSKSSEARRGTKYDYMLDPGRFILVNVISADLLKDPAAVKLGNGIMQFRKDMADKLAGRVKGAYLAHTLPSGISLVKFKDDGNSVFSVANTKALPGYTCVTSYETDENARLMYVTVAAMKGTFDSGADSLGRHRIIISADPGYPLRGPDGKQLLGPDGKPISTVDWSLVNRMEGMEGKPLEQPDWPGVPAKPYEAAANTPDELLAMQNLERSMLTTALSLAPPELPQ